jgi:hypothetical protein
VLLPPLLKGMPMRGPRFRARLRRLADLTLLGAFLALTVVAYGVFLAAAGQLMLSPVPQFSDFYQTGRNPWASATIEPAPPRFAAISGGTAFKPVSPPAPGHKR